MVGRKPLLWYLQELLTFLAAQSCPRIPRPPLDTSESESEVAQSCPTLCDPMDCSLPGSSVHGIFQAIVLEWIAISFSKGSSQPRDRTRVSRIIDRRFTVWARGDCPRLHVNKQRHYFANRGLSSQRYGFSSSHIWMWVLDYKESWMPKNWCFWAVVLEQILESPLDCKDSASPS